ncbi:hypothetical protein CC86DRAFT_24124 [Ophiobolus disseminans]|uniref:Uncharacterized protein n=1 Tax=Ophiobolus disseminans TaxID=1469910 RepID=A0A6A7A196_9PLEO|nr:hypothetical protein CC86DRAFT_24124 [Ophiobolus disseminans]
MMPIENTNPSLADDMPPELRLVVYSYVIGNDFKGDITSLESVFLSCKFIHKELGHELLQAFSKTLNATLDIITAQWTAAFYKPLQITHSGSRLHETTLTIGIPRSALHSTKDLDVPHRDDNGLGKVLEFLHPLLAFQFKRLAFRFCPDTSCEDDDAESIPRLLKDLICLVCRGHLDKFENSPTGRDEIEVDSVRAKQIVFEWKHTCQQSSQSICEQKLGLQPVFGVVGLDCRPIKRRMGRLN